MGCASRRFTPTTSPQAYRLAAKSDAEGAFNVAAEPVLDPAELGRLLAARPVKVPTGPLRAATALS